MRLITTYHNLLMRSSRCSLKRGDSISPLLQPLIQSLADNPGHRTLFSLTVFIQAFKVFRFKRYVLFDALFNETFNTSLANLLVELLVNVLVELLVNVLVKLLVNVLVYVYSLQKLMQLSNLKNTQKT